MPLCYEIHSAVFNEADSQGSVYVLQSEQTTLGRLTDAYTHGGPVNEPELCP